MGRALLSAAFEFGFDLDLGIWRGGSDTFNRFKCEFKVKSGGQECPRHTNRLTGGWVMRWLGFFWKISEGFLQVGVQLVEFGHGQL